MYAERHPGPDLADRIACVWHQASEGDTTHLVVPDACVDLIWGPDGLFVAGPDTGPMPTKMTAGDTFAGIRFRPGAAGTVFGVPVHELRDQRVPLGALPALTVPPPHPELRLITATPSPAPTPLNTAEPLHPTSPEDLHALSPEDLHALRRGDLRALRPGDLRALRRGDTPSPARGDVPFPARGDVPFSARGDLQAPGRADVPTFGHERFPTPGSEGVPALERGGLPPLARGDLRAMGREVEGRLAAMLVAIRSRLADTPDTDPAAPAIARALRMGRTVGEVAWDLGFSERQLHRRSVASFGYSPKILQRIVRFQRALTLARAGVPLADVAATAGYADQAHLSHDVKRLSGVPMGRLVSPVRRLA